MFFLDANSGIPLYVQLGQQLRQRIGSGQLKAGEQLPSVRDLSAELHVNPLTVAKVYQNLEREGFIETRRGIGSYVSARPPALRGDARREKLGPAVNQIVAEALHLGVGEDEVRALLAEEFRRLNRKDPHP